MANSLMPAAHNFLVAILVSLFCVQTVCALKVERLAPEGPVLTPAAGGVSRPGREVASGRAFVKFGAGISTITAEAALSAAGFAVMAPGLPGGWTPVGLPDGMSVAAALSVLRALPGAEAAEPSGIYRARRKSDDPGLILQYSLRLADVFRAWDYETGSSTKVTVGVIDTGIDGSHPELASKLAGTSQFCDPGANKSTDDGGACASNSPPTPACNHATRVAGVAAAASDNSAGVAGVSWGAGLLSLKVFRDVDCNSDCGDKSGTEICSTDDFAIIKAVNYGASLHNSAATGRIVLNLSLGEPYSPCGGALQTAITNAVSAGVIVAAAAGNDPNAGVDAPANCTGVIPVGATDINDAIASFSARGGEMSAGGVTAPGVGVYTTTLGGAYAYSDGTSFSSPFVAGLAALLWAANPSLSNVQVLNAIRSGALDRGAGGPDTVYGYGRVDAFKAMLLAKNGSTAGYTARSDMERAYAYPNPYNPSSGRSLSFSMPDGIFGSGLEVTVYTSEGEKVKKLSGPSWDGRNEAGHKVASGVYLFFMKTDNGTARGKFAVLR